MTLAAWQLTGWHGAGAIAKSLSYLKVEGKVGVELSWGL